MRTPPLFVDLPLPGAPGAAPGHRVEYRFVAGPADDAPLLVFLHEGLGSLSLWRDFPDRVCQTLGCRGLLYHTDADSAFFGWNDAWLDPAFRDFNIEAKLGGIQCAVLALQGEDDEYGTAAQIDGIAEHVDHAIIRHLARCGHTPHKDQPEAVIDALAEILNAAHST